MSGRASESQLDLLHGLLTAALTDELKSAIKRAMDPVNPQPLNPQLLDKAIKFLKDNGVSAPASSPKVDRLAATLEDLDLDAIALERHSH